MKSIRIMDVVCLVLVVALAMGSVVLAMQSYGERRSRLDAERSRIAELQSDLQDAEAVLRPMRAALASTRREWEDLDRKIPARGRIGDFLGQLDVLVAKHGVALQNLAPSPAVRETPYSRVPVRLQIAGSFTNLYHFLFDLETMDRVTEMGELTVRTVVPGEPCDLDLRISIFER